MGTSTLPTDVCFTGRVGTVFAVVYQTGHGRGAGRRAGGGAGLIGEGGLRYEEGRKAGYSMVSVVDRLHFIPLCSLVAQPTSRPTGGTRYYCPSGAFRFPPLLEEAATPAHLPLLGESGGAPDIESGRAP
jgi:hypothetical protein